MNRDFEPACHRMEWLDPFYKSVWERSFEKGIPISGTFELTPRCNFNCKMCYVHLKEDRIPKYGRELTGDEWIKIASEAKEAGTTWLCITGGEPLLHPEFPRIWKALSEMGFFLTLQTNASLIQGDRKKLLEQYPPRQVKVTLYGTNDQVYQDVCGVEHGFSRVNDGIHTLMSMGIPVSLVSTIIRENIEDAENMALYAYRHRLSWVPTDSVKVSLRGADTDMAASRLTEKEEARRRKGLEKRIQEQKYIDPERKPCTYCKDYRVGYWILWDGNMRFCSFLNEPNISVPKLGLEKAWHQLLNYEEALDWPAECRTCEANKVCLKCMASIATESGSNEKVPAEYCKQIKELYKERGEERWHKEKFM